MSVVAWDGNTLAADSYSQRGHQQLKQVKAFRISRDIIAGFCGVITDWWQVKTYLEGGAKPEGKLDFIAIIVRRNRDKIEVFTMEDSVVEVPCLMQKVAIGAGGDMALMAMECYHTAETAVYATARLCNVVDNNVTILSFDTDNVPDAEGQIDVTAF